MGSEVFINYRREDGAAYGAPLLYVVLAEHFGPDLVFMASMSIPPGHDFATELIARVRQCRVLLAVIGPEWLAVRRGGGRRIDDPEDWVRRELVEAFKAGVRVIPVLTDGARLPNENELPADIAWLARCQYRWLRTRDVVGDLDRLRRDLAGASPRLACARRGRLWSGPLTWIAYLVGWTANGGQRRSGAA